MVLNIKNIKVFFEINELRDAIIKTISGISIINKMGPYSDFIKDFNEILIKPETKNVSYFKFT